MHTFCSYLSLASWLYEYLFLCLPPWFNLCMSVCLPACQWASSLSTFFPNRSIHVASTRKFLLFTTNSFHAVFTGLSFSSDTSLPLVGRLSNQLKRLITEMAVEFLHMVPVNCRGITGLLPFQDEVVSPYHLVIGRRLAEGASWVKTTRGGNRGRKFGGDNCAIYSKWKTTCVYVCRCMSMVWVCGFIVCLARCACVRELVRMCKY